MYCIGLTEVFSHVESALFLLEHWARELSENLERPVSPKTSFGFMYSVKETVRKTSPSDSMHLLSHVQIWEKVCCPSVMTRPGVTILEKSKTKTS